MKRLAFNCDMFLQLVQKLRNIISPAPAVPSPPFFFPSHMWEVSFAKERKR
jgi:hypothetical protein